MIQEFVMDDNEYLKRMFLWSNKKIFQKYCPILLNKSSVNIYINTSVMYLCYLMLYI